MVVSKRLSVQPLNRGMLAEFETDLPATDCIRQRTEQRQVIFAAKEHDVFFHVVRQHSEIVVPIRLTTALVGVGARAEGDIVGRR